VRNRLLVAAAVLMLAACSGAPVVDTPAPSVARAGLTSHGPTPVPTPTPLPTPLPTPTPEQLAAACSGHAVASAAKYAGKVHPLVIASKDWAGSYGIDPASGINKNWRDGKWKSPIQLVVCIGKEGTKRVGSCGTYTSDHGVTGKVITLKAKQAIRVVVARTGKTLQSRTLYGPAPSCAKVYSISLGAPPPWPITGRSVTFAQINKYATAVSKQSTK
jgi:hypothetical protein